MTLQQMLRLSSVPGWILLVPEAERDATELMHDAWIGIMQDAERNRFHDVTALRKAIEEWKNEPGIKVFAKNARLRYLKGEWKKAIQMFGEKREAYIDVLRNKGERSQEAIDLTRQAESISKKIHGYEISIAVLEGRVDKKDLITNEMIERAREYPIKSLLEVGPNGRAKCIFHGGDGYNLDIRKNFGHCYVCGESGDTIRVYREKNGASFREAILALQ